MMNILDINETLSISEDKLSRYKLKIDRLKNAIEIFEEEDIPVPEAAYGSLAFYQSEFDKEKKDYQLLLKLIKYEDC